MPAESSRYRVPCPFSGRPRVAAAGDETESLLRGPLIEMAPAVGEVMRLVAK